MPDTLSADGYTFGGWYVDAECTKVWNAESDTVDSNMTLYAKWTEAAVPDTSDRTDLILWIL